MRKPLSQLGGAIRGPFLRFATIFLIAFPAFFNAAGQIHNQILLNKDASQIQNAPVGQPQAGGAVAKIFSNTKSKAQDSGAEDVETDEVFDQFPDQGVWLWGWVEPNSECNGVLSEGNWQITTLPQYGTATTAILDYNPITVGSCIGDYLPLNALIYTWTIAPPPISTTDPIAIDDTFSATWSAPVGLNISYNFDIKFSCPSPSITSITPSTWNAGQTYNVTITGTNFVTPTNVTNACFANLVHVITPSGSIVEMSNVTIASETQITATIAPPVGEPSEIATVQIEGGEGSTDASISVQVTGCPKPTVTQLLPKTWFAGESYPITITGTGFTTQSNATSSCPVTPVAIKTASGSSASLSNVTVVSSTQITANVEPAASDTTGTAALTIGTSSNGAQTIKTQILGNQIQWNGSTISTTDGSTPPTQNAVVGQQLALTTTTPTTTTYDGAPSSETWTVNNGTNIGGYTASTAGASVTPMPPLNTSALTFYSVYPQNGVSITYQYCVNIAGADSSLQCSLPANAVFNITGGGTMTNAPYNQLTIDQLIPCVGSVQPPLGSTQAPFVVYGNITGWNCAALYPGSTFGMIFTPSGAPSGGTYSYVQLINTDNIASIQGNISSSCTHTQGLDRNYPYQGIIPGNPPQAEDAPDDDLVNGFVETRTFNATMFLMWTSNLTNSIPVPIGYQTWGFSGSASQDITGTWSAITNGTPGPIGGFVPSSGNQTTDGYTALQFGYPIWSGPTVCM